MQRSQVVQRSRIAIGSFPRSGNTWVRYLLKYYTGVTPTAVYKGAESEDHNKTVFIKTHETDLYRYAKLIHVIRHPFDCFYSYWLWKKAFLKDYPTLSEHLKHCCAFWAEHTDHCLKANMPKIHIRYEDLIANAYAQLKRIIVFSNLTVDSDRITAAVERATFTNLRALETEDRIEWEGNSKDFFRAGNVGQGKKHLKPAYQRQIVNKLKDLMTEFRYSTHVDSKTIYFLRMFGRANQ